MNASFGGFRVYASAKVRYSSAVNAKARIVTETVWLNGTYDLITGAAALSLPSDFFVDVNFDVDVDGLSYLVTIPAGILCAAYSWASLHTCLQIAAAPRFLEEIGDELSDTTEDLIQNALSSFSAQEYVFYGLQDAFSEIPSIVDVDTTDLSEEVRDLLSVAEGKSISISISESFLDLGIDSASRYCYNNSRWTYGRSVVVSVVEVELSLPGVSLAVQNGVDTSYRMDCDGSCPRAYMVPFCELGPLNENPFPFP